MTPRREQWLTSILSGQNQQVIHCCPGLSDHSTKDQRIQRAIELIQSCHAFRINEVASFVSLSPSRFRHLFRQETGISPIRYLKLVRLVRAKELLMSSRLSVKEVAALLGGVDPTHLGREFKALYGLTPSQSKSGTNGILEIPQPLSLDNSRSGRGKVVVLSRIAGQAR